MKKKKKEKQELYVKTEATAHATFRNIMWNSYLSIVLSKVTTVRLAIALSTIYGFFQRFSFRGLVHQQSYVKRAFHQNTKISFYFDILPRLPPIKIKINK